MNAANIRAGNHPAQNTVRGIAAYSIGAKTSITVEIKNAISNKTTKLFDSNHKMMRNI
jgi:hypothetical protein